MRVIHKQTLQGFRPSIPNDARILSVQMQGNGMCVWYTVDPEAPALPVKRLLVVETGGEVPAEDQYTFVATVQDGPFVWHVFERLDAARAATTGEG